MTVISHFYRVLGMLVGVAFACFSWWLLVDAAARLPMVVTLNHMDIKPDDGAAIALGSDEFLQAGVGAMADAHILVRREGKAVLLYDITPERLVGYNPVGEPYNDTSGVVIQQGRSRIHVGNVVWSVENFHNSLVLTPGDGVTPYPRITLSAQTIEYRTSEMRSAGRVGLIARIQAWMRDQSIQYQLGGGLNTARIASILESRRIPDARLPRGSAFFVHKAGIWKLKRGFYPAHMEVAGERLDIEARPITLVDNAGRLQTASLILGRTEFDVRRLPADRGVRLVPVAKRAWLDATTISELPAEQSLTRSRSEPKQRLSDAEMKNSAFLVAIVTLGIWLLTWGKRFDGSRVTGFAGFGFLLTTLPLQFELSRLSTLAVAVGGALLIVILTSAFVSRNKNFRSFVRYIFMMAAAAMLFALALGFVDVVADFDSTTVSVETSITGAWLALLMPLFIPGLPAAAAIFWSLFVAVATFAAFGGIRLSIIEPTEKWMALMDKHLFALAAIGLAICFIANLAHEDRTRWAKQMLLPLGSGRFLNGFVLFVGLIFAGVIVIGDEIGFFGIFQPSEVAKSVLVLLVALTLSRDLTRRALLTSTEGAFSFFPLIALVLGVAIAVASLANFDMSPLLVSGVSVMATLMTGTAIHVGVLMRRNRARRYQGLPIPRKKISRNDVQPEQFWPVLRRYIWMRSSFWPVGALGFAISAVLLFVGWVYAFSSAESRATTIAQGWLVTPWRRLQSWFDMQLGSTDGLINFPETGLQLRLGREAILESYCRMQSFLCPRSLPVVEQEGATEALLRVPAIQDDFAAISLIHALGADGAFAYAALQLSMILAAITIGIFALISRREMVLGEWFVGCAAIGMTTVVFAQVALAWGNVLGLLPIMGQPMTFVSFGASHHLGVALPFAVMVVVAAYIGAPIIGGTDTARSNLYRRRRGA